GRERDQQNKDASLIAPRHGLMMISSVLTIGLSQTRILPHAGLGAAAMPSSIRMPATPVLFPFRPIPARTAASPESRWRGRNWSTRAAVHPREEPLPIAGPH